MSKKTDKLSFGQLALISLLAEKPDDRVLTTFNGYGNDTGHYSLHEYDPSIRSEDGGRDGWKRLEQVTYLPETSPPDNNPVSLQEYCGGSFNFSLLNLHRSEIVDDIVGWHWKTSDHASERGKRLLPSGERPFSIRAQTAVVWLTELGEQWWKEQGRDLYISAASARLKKQAEAARVILIGVKSRVNYSPTKEEREKWGASAHVSVPTRTLFRPYATATVKKETDSRLYIKDIQQLPSHIPVTSYSDTPVKGYEPNEYVAKEDVMIDHLTPDRLAKVLAADRTIIDDITERQAREFNELVEIHHRLRNSRTQAEAMYASIMNEALGVENSLTEEDSIPKPHRR